MAANDASGPNSSKKPRLSTGTTATGGGWLENSLPREESAKKWSSMDAPDQTLELDFKEILKGSSMQLLQVHPLNQWLVFGRCRARRYFYMDLLTDPVSSEAFHARLNICTNLRKELAVASKARKEAEDLLRAEREARQKEREGFLELISSLEKELGKFLEEKVAALEQSEQSLQEALQSQEKALVGLRSSMGTIRKGACRAGQAYSSFSRLHGKLRELSVANNLGQVPPPQDHISPSLDPNFVVDQAVQRQHKRDENYHDDDEDSIPLSARLKPHKKKA